jgi:hypothetical protein
MRQQVDDLLHPAAGPHGGDRTSEQDNNVILPRQGNSREYYLRRLRRDNPGLADKVVAGELSAYKAAVMAGIVRRHFSLSSDIDSMLKTLRAQLPEATLRELGQRLLATED